MKMSKFLKFAGTVLVGGGAAAVGSVALSKMQGAMWTPKYRAGVLGALGAGVGIAAQFADSQLVNEVGQTIAAGTTAIAAGDAIQIYGLDTAVQNAVNPPATPQTPPANTAPSGYVPQLGAGAQRYAAAARQVYGAAY